MGGSHRVCPQIPIFLYVSSEMREIATYGKMQLMQYELTPDAPLDASVDPTLAQMSADFTTSGLLWFTDLTVPDPQYVLPVAVCGLMYTSLEVGFGGGSQDSVKKATIFTMLKSGLQQGAILGLPFVAAFPASVQVRLGGQRTRCQARILARLSRVLRVTQSEQRF